ncbi:uncharacterized protein HD556DRAFT_252627 [Suillus plorans]|uniref:Uncharacterized protein n=1 Tax=Suillus plorans TaxID=116603 RepID=A0A9P7DKX5_9AGAM|nr:uncharacterized protein HD556DRAFT_252627 [Suillus plorans]KAG1797369.1 hypothetical protein HD556DRAFT_252627 [Suillus plorans]
MAGAFGWAQFDSQKSLSLRLRFTAVHLNSGYVHHNLPSYLASGRIGTASFTWSPRSNRREHIVYRHTRTTRSCWTVMINHPYGAASSYMYANVDNSYSQSYVSPPPDHLYSFVPRFSVDSMPWYGATEYSPTSNINYNRDSLPFRWTVRVCLQRTLYYTCSEYCLPQERACQLFKGVQSKVRIRWRPLHLRSLFLRPCHYDVRDDPDIYF